MFPIAGRGLTVSISRDADVAGRSAGIARLEAGERFDGNWVAQRVLNGDRSSQGRQLSLAASLMPTYRVVLYTVPREPSK